MKIGAIFGFTNSGSDSLINTLNGQHIAQESSGYGIS